MFKTPQRMFSHPVINRIIEKKENMLAAPLSAETADKPRMKSIQIRYPLSAKALRALFSAIWLLFSLDTEK